MEAKQTKSLKWENRGFAWSDSIDSLVSFVFSVLSKMHWEKHLHNPTVNAFQFIINWIVNRIKLSQIELFWICSFFKFNQNPVNWIYSSMMHRSNC